MDLNNLLQTAKQRGKSVADALQAEHEDAGASFRNQRDDTLALMRMMINDAEGRKFTAQEQSDWRQLEQRAEDLNRKISVDQAELDAAARNEFSGFAGSDRDQWFDAASRQTINVYGPSEKLAENSTSRVSTGDLIRAKITGRGTPDVMAALEEGTDSSGGFLVPTPLSSNLIDRMRARQRVVQAGARTVNMETENLAIAKIASDPTPGWRLENDAITESEPTFERVNFTARWLGVLVKTSRELAEDAPNFATAIEQSIAGALAVEWDRVALLGSGTAPEPEGISNTTGVHEIDMGTDGAALTGYGKVLEAVAATANANADKPSAMVMNPRELYTGFASLTADDGQPLMAPSAISDIPMLETSSIPTDEAHGTADNASRIIMGDFSQLLLGVRSDVRLEVMPGPFASNHQLAIIAWIRADVALAQPKAFSQIVGITP